MDLRHLHTTLRRDRARIPWARRAVIGLSLVGAASMAATSLLQAGVLRHLPDPPLEGFDSDKVNLSKHVFPFGIPDGVIALVGFALNVPLAAFGGADRAREQPWLPVLSAAKSAADAAVTGWYFYQMPTKERAWCAYCITAALASFAILAFSLPEARKALTS